MKNSISIVLITHNSKKHLPFCLPPLLASPLKPRILVVNSSSTDGTLELAEQMGAETLKIPRSQFNHGTTRELARKHVGGEIFIMMTPDAYPESPDFLVPLIAPLQEKKAAVSYARQLPHKNAHFFESFARHFNYPQITTLRSLKDLPSLGADLFFCSNACAAYSQEALDAIGGFKPVLMGEDTLAAAELLHNGGAIAYVAEAKVYHSHAYSLWQEFQRHFDSGLSRKAQKKLLFSHGNDTSRGFLYAKTLLKATYQEKPHLLPYACAHLASKWLGYQAGQMLNCAPILLKKRLSSQDFYWTMGDYTDRD